MLDTFTFEDNRILECGTDTPDRGYQTKYLDSTLATYESNLIIQYCKLIIDSHSYYMGMYRV
jgi:hypothetical protein